MALPWTGPIARSYLSSYSPPTTATIVTVPRPQWRDCGFTEMRADRQTRALYPPRRRCIFTNGAVPLATQHGHRYGGFSAATFIGELSQWTGIGKSLGRVKGDFHAFTDEAEIRAIDLGLDIAELFAHAVEEVVIVTDCKTAIADVEMAHFQQRYHHLNEELLEKISGKMSDLESVGVRVRLEWVKSHLPMHGENYQAQGNWVVDRMATRAAGASLDWNAEMGEWEEALFLEPVTHGEGNEFNARWVIPNWRLDRPAERFSNGRYPVGER